MDGTDDRAQRWAEVSAHRARLLAIARARVPDEADAEDCAHEAMLRAVEFDHLDEGRLAQFLTSVTVRLCADYHRARVRGDRASRRAALRELREPTPEEAVCDRFEAEWIARQVDTLPEPQQVALRARAAGLPVLVVAERLAVPGTTVESALARARRSLRRTLESSFGVVPLARRWPVAAGAAASAGVLLHLPADPGARPAQAAPPPVAAPRATKAAPGPGAAALRPRPPRPTLAAAVPSGPPAGDRNDRRPRPPVVVPYDPSAGGASFPGGGLDIEPAGPGRGPEYSDVERAGHCLEYGVYVAPRTDCGYPPGDPRNERFPRDSVSVHPPRPRQEAP